MCDSLFWHELLKIPEGELVGVLKLSVIFTVFLNSVICQVDEVIIDVTCRESFSWCTDIALFEEVYIHLLSQKTPHTNVKFAVMNQERFLDVFLYYKRASVKPKFLCTDKFLLWGWLQLCCVFLAVLKVAVLFLYGFLWFLMYFLMFFLFLRHFFKLFSIHEF